jgi:hypothetical protein
MTDNPFAPPQSNVDIEFDTPSNNLLTGSIKRLNFSTLLKIIINSFTIFKAHWINWTLFSIFWIFAPLLIIGFIISILSILTGNPLFSMKTDGFRIGQFLGLFATPIIIAVFLKLTSKRIKKFENNEKLIIRDIFRGFLNKIFKVIFTLALSIWLVRIFSAIVIYSIFKYSGGQLLGLSDWIVFISTPQSLVRDYGFIVSLSLFLLTTAIYLFTPHLLANHSQLSPIKAIFWSILAFVKSFHIWLMAAVFFIIIFLLIGVIMIIPIIGQIIGFGLVLMLISYLFIFSYRAYREIFIE